MRKKERIKHIFFVGVLTTDNKDFTFVNDTPILNNLCICPKLGMMLDTENAVNFTDIEKNVCGLKKNIVVRFADNNKFDTDIFYMSVFDFVTKTAKITRRQGRKKNDFTKQFESQKKWLQFVESLTE